MISISKLVTAAGLAATVLLGTLPATPAHAQGPVVRHIQQRRAARMQRRATRAAFRGNYRRAARLRRHSVRLRRAARHGF